MATYNIGPGETYETFADFFLNITPSAGDIIDGGGEEFAENIIIPSSGVSDNQITYRNFKVDGTGKTECIRILNQSYIVLDSVELYNATTAGLQIITGSHDIIINNSSFYNNADKGSLVTSYSTSTQCYNITYNNCAAYNNGGHGFHCTYNVHDVVYNYCESHHNGSSSATHGFSSWTSSGSKTSGWTLESGTIYKRQISADTAWFTDVLNVVDLSNNVRLTHNDGNFASLGTNEWDLESGWLYINIGGDPNGVSIKYQPTECYNIIYNYCIMRDQNAIGVEGHGMSFDDFSTGIVYGCLIYNNGGKGAGNNMGTGAIFMYCTIFNNGGIGITPSRCVGTKIINCTIVGNGEHGVGIQAACDGVMVINSIFAFNGWYGINSATLNVTNTICTHNATYGNSLGNTYQITNSNPITTDPLFTDLANKDFTLNVLSPCVGTGKITSFRGLDYAGKPAMQGRKMNIGAYASHLGAASSRAAASSRSSAPTRTAATTRTERS